MLSFLTTDKPFLHNFYFPKHNVLKFQIEPSWFHLIPKNVYTLAPRTGVIGGNIITPAVRVVFIQLSHNVRNLKTGGGLNVGAWQNCFFAFSRLTLNQAKLTTTQQKVMMWYMNRKNDWWVGDKGYDYYQNRSVIWIYHYFWLNRPSFFVKQGSNFCMLPDVLWLVECRLFWLIPWCQFLPTRFYNSLTPAER